MRLYKCVFRDSAKHIIAVATAECMTIGAAVTMAQNIIEVQTDDGYKTLANARHLTVDLVGETE